MSIPPTGWGAVEALIWDQTLCLRKMGAEVHIVNTSDQNEMVRQVNALNPDIVHLQYDDYYSILPRINCRAKVATSHFGYLEDPTFHGQWSYGHIFSGFINGNFTIAALSKGIKDRYVNAGCNPNRIYVAPNGANEDSFRYSDTPAFPDRSIYLAKIEERKKQYKYQDVPNLYFAGHSICNKFMPGHPRHLGEWTKTILYDSLTDYGNLVLLSDGEAHPLVVCEALICGLGVVVSRVASANLDTSKPWITVIPDDKLDDIAYVTTAIEENRRVAVASRAEIREYALANVSWTVRTAHLYELYKIMTGLA